MATFLHTYACKTESTLVINLKKFVRKIKSAIPRLTVNLKFDQKCLLLFLVIHKTLRKSVTLTLLSCFPIHLLRLLLRLPPPPPPSNMASEAAEKSIV